MQLIRPPLSGPRRNAAETAAAVTAAMPAARAQVLAAYRGHRRAGLPPDIALRTIRDAAAGAYLECVVHAIDPSPAMAARYAAADAYLGSLARRPAWWWRPW